MKKLYDKKMANLTKDLKNNTTKIYQTNQNGRNERPNRSVMKH